jgi:aminopeptidase-like protein
MASQRGIMTADDMSAQAFPVQGRTTGDRMHALVAELYPICRSITGDGVRQTLDRLAEDLPLQIVEIPTGTSVFDWTIPKEWNVRDAYVKDAQGNRVIDFAKSNLHLLNYSAPYRGRLSLDELRPHLHSDPEHPDWIPYRTTYYREQWGFCLSHQQLSSLAEGEYDVVIDSSLTQGTMRYGECFLPGTSAREVLVSVHVCHPSLANDNLSGISVAAFLAKHLAERPRRRYSYRFLFIPGTIGAIAWLALNKDRAGAVAHGFVLTCVGDRGKYHYKRSRQGNAEIDRAMEHVLAALSTSSEIRDFTPYGYDERQYCSPGFNLPVGCLMRSVWGEFPEYHTSADDLSFVTADALEESLEVCKSVVDVLENNRVYLSTNPFCEPALGKRGLYRATGGQGIGSDNLTRLWVMNLADGQHSLLDIAERAAMPFATVASAAQELAGHGLLVEQGSATA